MFDIQLLGNGRNWRCSCLDTFGRGDCFEQAPALAMSSDVKISHAALSQRSAARYLVVATDDAAADGLTAAPKEDRNDA